MPHIITPQKKERESLKNKTKREKHARKIPSSLGLFIEDSSCFFVSGPGVKTKRGGKRKDKIQKDFTALKQKEQKIPKQQNKKNDKLARDHVSHLKRRAKNSSQSKPMKQTANSEEEKERETDGGVTSANIPTSSYNVIVGFFPPQFSLSHTLIRYMPGFQ